MTGIYIMTAQQTIGFIGFGAMASRMGNNLKKAGYALVAYTPSGKGGDGSTPFLPSPADVAKKADIVLVCVPDDEALAAAMYGENGALAGMRANQLLLNTSSVSPEATDALQKAGQAKGISVIDCPVSGSTRKPMPPHWSFWPVVMMPFWPVPDQYLTVLAKPPSTQARPAAAHA